MGVAPAQGAKRAHPGRRAEEPPPQVQVVRALVEQDPPALARPGGPPAPRGVVGVGPKPVGHRPGHPAHRSQLPALQQRAQAAVARVGALVEHGPKDQRGGGRRGGEQAPRGGHVHGHRLFHEHVQAGGQGGAAQRHVGKVRGGDQHRVHPPTPHHRLRVSETGRQGEACQHLCRYVADRTQLAVINLSGKHFAGMMPTHAADADDAQPDLICHC